MTSVNRKMFWTLLALTLMSVVFVFPYILSVQGEVIRNASLSVEFIFLTQLLQSAILFSVLIFLGLKFSKQVGFDLPLLRSFFSGDDEYKKTAKAIAIPSILWGVTVAIAIYLADLLFVYSGTGISTHENYAPVWQKLLASFYGGITEEVIMRLFLMSFFVWIGMKIVRLQEPSKTVIMISIVLAAVIFGLGHLPITASITSITPLVVARAIVLNGIGGLVFGWLFWRRGLESAILAHFTADIFLLTLLPMVFK